MAGNEQVKEVLQSLHKTMQDSGAWSEVALHPQVLRSQQPFCLDTMNFSQWLQFVFIPKMHGIIDANEALPNLVKGQGIEPMASEFYKSTEGGRDIIALIRQLDSLLQA